LLCAGQILPDPQPRFFHQYRPELSYIDKGQGRFAAMKATALITAFLIGLVAGISFSQPLRIEISSEQIKEDIRRGID